MNLDELEQNCNECKACELFKTKTKNVFSDGNKKARIMIIGEAPGKEEDETGKPFVGRAGIFLSKLLEETGISRQNDVYITNTLKCRPPQNRVPKLSEKKACENFLLSQIELVNPKIIVMVGSTAMSSFIKTDEKITQIRGKWLQLNINGKKIKGMVIFHPSYLLRQHSQKIDAPRSLTISDLRIIKNEIK